MWCHMRAWPSGLSYYIEYGPQMGVVAIVMFVSRVENGIGDR